MCKKTLYLATNRMMFAALIYFFASSLVISYILLHIISIYSSFVGHYHTFINRLDDYYRRQQIFVVAAITVYINLLAIIIKSLLSHFILLYSSFTHENIYYSLHHHLLILYTAVQYLQSYTVCMYIFYSLTKNYHFSPSGVC